MTGCYPIWTSLVDHNEVAAAVVKRISAAARQAIANHGRFRLVLAGGRTPQAAYFLLRDTNQDWQYWEVYFGDERCLPVDHPERNSRMAAEALLDHVPIPEHQVSPIPAELGPAAGAQAYRTLISERLPFDLVLLGMGEDGHTASLFPGRSIDRRALVVAVQGAPKPPPQRVSLGYAALRRTAKMLVAVTGRDKHAAVDRWRAGDDLPIASVSDGMAVEVLIDEAAFLSPHTQR
jgi:6-phosphogluconolactonase